MISSWVRHHYPSFKFFYSFLIFFLLFHLSSSELHRISTGRVFTGSYRKGWGLWRTVKVDYFTRPYQTSLRKLSFPSTTHSYRSHSGEFSITKRKPRPLYRPDSLWDDVLFSVWMFPLSPFSTSLFVSAFNLLLDLKSHSVTQGIQSIYYENLNDTSVRTVLDVNLNFGLTSFSKFLWFYSLSCWCFFLIKQLILKYLV